MKPSLFFPALVLMALFSLPGCRYNREQKQLIDLAERIVEEHPDSALLLLNTFQQDDIQSPRLKARYGIVKSMAYTKTWIEPGSDSLIGPAVRYYKKHRAFIYRMKAWYYYGRVFAYNKDFPAALYAYSQARDASEKTSDFKYKGLISMGMAHAYSNTYCDKEALKEIEHALPFFSRIHDYYNYNVALVQKAQVFIPLHRWNEAETLLDSLITHAQTDTVSMRRALLTFATLCMSKPFNEPQKCLDLSKKAIQVYHASLTEKDWCIMAQAYSELGQTRVAEDILSQVEQLAPDFTMVSNFKALVARDKGDYKTAFDLLFSALDTQNDIVLETLSQSSIVAQRDYFEAQRKEEALVARKRALVIAQISLGSLITLGILMFSFTRRRRRDERRLKAVEQEKTELRAMSLGSNENLKTVLAERDAQKAEINRLHQKETRAALRNLQSQFKSVAEDIDLNRELQNTIDPKLKREKAYQHICDAAAAFSGSDKAYKNLEKTVDNQLDDVMKKFRREVSLPKEEDYRFVCYQIVGFPAHLIAHLCNLSVGSVYTKKSILTDQIEASDYPHRDTFLMVLGNSKNFTTFV